MKSVPAIPLLFAVLLLIVRAACAEDLYAPASPLRPWPPNFPETALQQPRDQSPGRRALLWLPNRLLDLLDVLHVDAGIGRAYGFTARLTKYGQAGYRHIDESFRIGLFGREAPFLLERQDEFGIGPWYENGERHICSGEIGAGGDLFLVGGYAGVCFDELADFFAGIFLWDYKGDDLN